MNDTNDVQRAIDDFKQGLTAVEDLREMRRKRRDLTAEQRQELDAMITLHDDLSRFFDLPAVPEGARERALQRLVDETGVSLPDDVHLLHLDQDVAEAEADDPVIGRIEPYRGPDVLAAGKEFHDEAERKKGKPADQADEAEENND